MDNHQDNILAFSVDNTRIALYLKDVERVIRAIAHASVPKAAPSLYGIIDLQGEHIPVVNLRERFGMPQRPVTPGDRMIISGWGKKKLAIVVDEVEQPMAIYRSDIKQLELPENQTLKQEMANSGLEIVRTVSDQKGLIIIYDLPKLLGHETILAVDELFSRIKNEDLHV